MDITLYNRQRKLRIPLAWLRSLAPHALEAARQHLHTPTAPLQTLEEVEVTFVSNATIARVHVDFMGIPGPTDVITFAHGEIVISPETARDYATDYGRTLDEELALYIIHGLLHLAGHEDSEPDDAARMHRIQEEILTHCLHRMTLQP